MPHYDTTLSSKGRITLPVGLRQALQLEAGDTITWIDTGKSPALEIGGLRMRIIQRENARAGLAETTGILRDYVRDMPVMTIEDMDKAIEQSIIEEHERELREAEEGYAAGEVEIAARLPSVSTRVTTKGQITMPESYRHKYGMQDGDAVVLNDEIGQLSVLKAEDILARLAGSLSAYAGNGSVEIDREQIWTEIATERDERIWERLREQSGSDDDPD
jgi:bifunctional DNA-binding transcriptional regulator/antitoxin component of YhaV-PrlF toxin-antitoxin module